MKKIILLLAGISLCGAISNMASAQCVSIDSIVKAHNTELGDSLCNRTVRVYYQRNSSGQNSVSPSYSLDGNAYTSFPCVATNGTNGTHDSFDVEIDSVTCSANIYLKISAHTAPNCGGKACATTTFFGNDKLVDGNTLPVNLVSFIVNEASCNEVLLQWTTTNQDNFSHFEIEYSADGKNFSGVRNVWPNLQDALEARYSVTVNQNSKKGYYRLKMVDVNQSFKFSEVRSVNLSCGGDNTLGLVLSPNPVYNQVNIKGTDSRQVIKIFNTQNELVLEVNGQAGNTAIDVNKLASGLYNAIVIDGAIRKASLRFIKR